GSLDDFEGPPRIGGAIAAEGEQFRINVEAFLVAGPIVLVARRMVRENLDQIADAVAVGIFVEDCVEPGLDSRALASLAQLVLDGFQTQSKRVVRLVGVVILLAGRIGQVARRAGVEMLRQIRAEVLRERLLVRGASVQRNGNKQQRGKSEEGTAWHG